MKNIYKFAVLAFAFGFIFIGVEMANAQSRRDVREARREYREEVRDARRDYRRDTNRRINRRVYRTNNSRYYYYNGRLYRRW